MVLFNVFTSLVNDIFSDKSLMPLPKLQKISFANEEPPAGSYRYKCNITAHYCQLVVF